MNYPTSVYLILVSVLCEAFAFNLYYDFLYIYLFNAPLEKDTSFKMMNIFLILINFFPILGAMIADSWLGKYQTIIYFNIINILGKLVLLITAFSYFKRDQVIIALLLTAMGTGGIRACIQAIGGDQFTLPQQKNHLTNFFWFYYFMRYAGSYISFHVHGKIYNSLTDKERKPDYASMFSIPFVVTIISLVIFAAGAKVYKKTEVKKNIIMKVDSCAWHAIIHKMRSNEVRNHWLDYADDRYDKKIIEDTKLFHKVSKFLVPLPFFWAVYAYIFLLLRIQEIRVLQPTMYEGLQNLKETTILILIPVTRFIIFPIIGTILSINTPLRRMTFGGILIGISLVISAIFELYGLSLLSQSIYWFLLQQIVFAIGEMIFSVSGMEFVFTQAPLSMKSWLQACWLLNIGIGDLIKFFIPYEQQVFKKPTSDHFLFAGLIFGLTFIFALIARYHKYVEDSPTENSRNNNTNLQRT